MKKIVPHSVGEKISLPLCPIFFMLICFLGYGQKENGVSGYSIDIKGPEKEIYSKLDLGGKNNAGESISVNNYYISRNGKPIIPITGEFHFSRYPEQYWDEAIKKMKAGGINMIATYIFWIMHEEDEGVFDFEGEKDIRKFVELCAQNDMPVIIRIGPFDHGEIRNGGLPDWLLAKPISVRSNDPEYLSYAERLYDKVGEQLKGLFFKDGGPIIATQIENEYQHSAAPWGLTYPGQPADYTSADRDLARIKKGVSVSKEKNPYAKLGNDHMKVLKSLAINAGIETPLYTATGWGNAAIIPNESLPVTAAYAYPTWTKNEEPSPFYLYKKMHKSPDYSPVRYNPEDYPAFAAELGAGIMPTYTRRPLVPAESVDALINRCLGSGANGIGYYMYHGGSTPKGKHNFMNDEAVGATKISYDFQAPIGEFGQTRESFHRLKLIHEFLNGFADKLAPMTTVLPKGNENIKPSDTEKLRYAVRHKGDTGFLFLNNFQDHAATTDKNNIQINLKTAQGDLNLPEKGGFDLKSGENAIFPFNFDMAGAKLKYATAQLLTKSDDEADPYFVFFSPKGIEPEFSFKKAEGLTISNILRTTVESDGDRWKINCPDEDISEFVLENQGKSTKVLVVDKDFALKSWEVNIDGSKYLVFSDADVLEGKNGTEFISKKANAFDVFVYPKINFTPKISIGSISKVVDDETVSHFKVELPKVTVPFKSKKVNSKRLVVNFNGGMPEGLHDVILKIDYVGDTAMGFVNGKLVADEFYKGIPWEVGLRYFLKEKKTKTMNFYFRPIYKDAPYLVDLEKGKQPDFSKKEKFTEINEVKFIPVYQSNIKFND